MIKLKNRSLKRFPGNGTLRSRIFHRIKTRPRLNLWYLRLAKKFASHGIRPPLTLPYGASEAKWQEQGTENSKVAPQKYTIFDDSINKLFQDILPFLSPESNILEIGCNAGRSLDYLYRKGFKNLTGIEIGAQALETFKEVFPETYQSATIIHGNAVNKVKQIPSKSFDLVFTHSVLVNIEAKHNQIFHEICRICRGYILTLESEGSAGVFPRYFQRMFEKNGFAMVSFRWLVWDKDHTLVFPHPITAKDILKNNTIRLFVPVDKSACGGGYTTPPLI